MNYQKKLTRADIMFFTGASTCGKGYKAKLLTQDETRLVWFDLPADFEPKQVKGKVTKRYQKNCKIVEGDLKEFLRLIKQPQFRIIYRPNLGDKQLAYEFDIVCKAVLAIGSLCYVVDELGDVTTATSAPASWKAICKRGRHRGIKLRGIDTRPANVHKGIISSATEIYAGRLEEPADIRPLRSRMGKEKTDKLPNLPLRTLLHWSGA